MGPPRKRAQLRGLLVAAAIAAPLVVAEGMQMAAADDAAEPIRLAYHAGPGCPSEDAFVGRVRVRMPRVRLVAGDEPGRTFAVALVPAGPGAAQASGSVSVMDGTRSEGTRRLEATTCDEVADALALMVVLAIDSRSLSATAASATPSAPLLDGSPLDGSPLDGSAPPPALPVPTDASAPLVPDALPTAAPVSAASGAPGNSAALTESEEPSPTQGSRSDARPNARLGHFLVGGDFAVAVGVTPVPLFAGAPVVGWRTTGASLFGASIRASFLRAGTGSVRTLGANADFTWTAGRLDACGMLWPNHPLRLGACARAEVGVLDVSGDDIAVSKTVHSPWVAGGLLARAEWSFYGPFVLGIGAGPVVHITADRFYFLANTTTSTVFQVPDYGFWAEAGAGIHFL